MSGDRESWIYDDLTRLNNELTNLHRELARKNAELARLNEHKNRVLGVAAHDLRTPIGAILAYSDFLENEAAPNLTSAQIEYLHIIKRSGQCALNLLENLLDTTRIETNGLTLMPQATNLARLIGRNVVLNQAFAEIKSIRIAMQLKAFPPPMMLDAQKIEQVLNNLITNAVKFSHPGSVITVHMTQEEGRVLIAIRDQGVGIPEAELPLLFKPFSRTSAQSTAGEKSYGLGLAIVADIVRAHGGEVEVKSKVGEGSTFTVALPINL